MGFGHRVYKVRDPRADVLAAAAERMFTRAGDMSLYTLARAVEAHGASAARGVQARTPAADERRVLHGAPAARARPRRRAVHADVRDQPRQRLDRARARAAARQSDHPSAVGVLGPDAIEPGCRFRSGEPELAQQGHDGQTLPVNVERHDRSASAGPSSPQAFLSVPRRACRRRPPIRLSSRQSSTCPRNTCSFR